MKNKLFIVIALMGLTMLFSSCAKFPQTQFDATTAAIQTAKESGADVYVPQVYQALTDSLKSATVKAEVVKAQWFFPSYKEVNTLLVATMDSAVQAKAKVEVRKAQLKAENDALVVEVKALVDSNIALLSKAPKGKDGKAALAAISTDLEVVSYTLTEVENLSSTGDLLGSNSKLKTSKDKALSIKSELETAIEKASVKAPAKVKIPVKTVKVKK